MVNDTEKISGKKHIFTAYAIKRGSNLKSVFKEREKKDSLTGQGDVIAQSSSDGSGFYLFKFGVLVCLNVENVSNYWAKYKHGDKIGNEIILDDISDEFAVYENKSVPPVLLWGALSIDELTMERMEVVARCLAQSVALECIEKEVDLKLDSIEKESLVLSKKRRIPFFTGTAQPLLFEVVKLKNFIISGLSLLDKPDVLWNDRVMDNLYGNIQDMFDIKERYSALQKKIAFLQNSLELIVDTIRDNRMFWLTTTVVACFVVAIAIMLAMMK